jgi:SsrA-binding protein
MKKSKRIINKKARFNYNVLEEIEAGIVLTGAEVKAFRRGAVDMGNSYARFVGNELYLLNTNFAVENTADINPTRSRKLLIHGKEIVSLSAKIKAKSLTFVPVAMYTRGRFVKVSLGLAKPKKKFDKRKTIKEKDIKRDIERELKG